MLLDDVTRRYLESVFEWLSSRQYSYFGRNNSCCQMLAKDEN